MPHNYHLMLAYGKINVRALGSDAPAIMPGSSSVALKFFNATSSDVARSVRALGSLGVAVSVLNQGVSEMFYGMASGVSCEYFF
jgi:hypothetical protein